MTRHTRHLRLSLLAAISLLVAAGGAQARETERDIAVATPLPAWQQECGACHLAYPPALLPAPAWRRLMQGLGKHYGTDASLDGAARAGIEHWLVANAGGGGNGPADNRITHAAWFRDEHGEIPGSVFRREAVKSPANCAACHRGATSGAFDEHDVAIPR